MSPRTPLALTAKTLALYRPGALVAVALGALADFPAVRPVAYNARASADGVEVVQAAAPRPGSLTRVVQVRGALVQRAGDLPCGGYACGYDSIEEDVKASCRDAGVGQLLLDVDSNGGDVAGLEEGGRRMRSMIVASGKPCIGFVNEKAFSAALYLMLALCDGIYVPASGRMGCVGAVVGFKSNARKLAEAGEDVYIARDPAGKMVPNSDEPLDELGKSRLDRFAAEGSARFFAFVATGGARGKGIPENVARSWNGDTFTGATCVTAGLADGVQSLEETIALAESWPRREAA